jgi:opacity protein-like surface antigen
MRTIKLAILLSITVFICITTTAEAQRITAGGGVGYGSKSENVNFQVNAYYQLPTLPLRIGGDVGYSKPESDINEIEGNVNLHFLAVDTDLITLYTITGLNVLHLRASIGNETVTDTDTGFNLGAGAELDLGFGRGFGEAKYIVGSEREEQWVFGVGVRVSISN